MADKDDKSDKGWPDDGREWREWTELDDVQGEWIARKVEEKAHEDAEHYRQAHSKDPIDGIMNSIFGTSDECINPRCESEEKHARFEALEQEQRESESWWERWSREREEKRVLSELTAESDSESSESWWDRWFRGSNNGGDGEGGD